MVKFETVKNYVLAVLAAAGSLLSRALGGWDAALQTLVLFMALDYLTGLMCALVFKKSQKTQNGAADSRICFKGLIKKAAILFCILIGTELDRLIGNGAYCRMGVMLFFMGNEGLSVLENLGLMGIPLPAFIKNALELLKNKGDSGEK